MIHHALSRWLPPSKPVRRPFELIYAADECPPRGALGLLALQHAATVLALIAHVLAAAKIAGLSLPQTHSIVAMTLLGMAMGTALQAWGGRWGSGTLLVFQPDPMMITVAGAAIASYGLGSMVQVSLIAAGVTLCVGPLMRHLRALFPPTVVGTVVCMGGLGLVEPAMRNALGIHEASAGAASGLQTLQIDGISALISGATLASIVVLSVWGGRRFKLLGVLAGLLMGLLIAALSDRLLGLEWLHSAPWLALPQPIAPSFNLGPEIIFAIVLIATLNQLDNIGCLIVMDKTDNADWRRADMQMVGRGIRANGASDFLSGLFGSFPTAPSSANIALVHATGSSSRYIGLACAALLLLVALSPLLTMALTLIPQAVLGAISLYAAAYLIVSGIEMIATRALDSRGIFMVGLSLCAGLATMLMPGLSQGLPEGVAMLAGDGFVVTGVCVMGLNLLFRLGTRLRASCELDPGQGAGQGSINHQLTAFVERQGAAWGARMDIVRRAALAALEASEAIQAAGGGRLLVIRGSFDEFNFDLELLHEGEPLRLGGSAAGSGDGSAGAAATAEAPLDLDALMDSDEDIERQLDAAMARVSGVLIRHLADKLSSASLGAGQAVLRLHFDH
ncbi:uracil-xanthine permease family protein [Kinneretia aquatilis]|uniref:uracil-xanthine permease family protein n=1 Tax=Kinneretia aquatilis TaxID=2070761 RepID=UPI001495261F|nr:solute carrier family 23 protein [Paucibacter aquatile]WIV97159.1 solute carrier family 23 protein [Paucibacter aquatile]